jgi:hypothetical protein
MLTVSPRGDAGVGGCLSPFSPRPMRRQTREAVWAMTSTRKPGERQAGPGGQGSKTAVGLHVELGGLRLELDDLRAGRPPDQPPPVGAAHSVGGESRGDHRAKWAMSRTAN